MSQSAAEGAPRDAPGAARRKGPTAGERLARAAGRSWRPAALLLVCCAAWWATAAAELVEPYLVPSPGATFDVLTGEADHLWRHTWVTTYETLLGFGIAVAVGVLSAVVMVSSPTVEKTLYPVLLFAQVIPKIAIAPLFVVWLGFGIAPKILIAVLIAFFPVVISMVTGLKAVDPEMLQLSATMGARPWQTFVKIRFPASLPHLFSGLKVAVTLAVTGAVVGEFVGADEGLGYVILQANGNLDTPMLFAALLVMSLIGVVLFVLVEAAERLLLPWHASRRDPRTGTTAY
ncbi:ABC transporter permease [Streptomyces clavuligerus]|uniref:ABC transporter permease n=1 Tax=Streptomyces clavuligerus TaxID=1901 RepID=UPI00020D90E7|nr:ABC transporter permease [Streptomyces clavuligerus]ANW17206.1 ABC transporter permease [Streptomyces clavuligerus]AXU11744.1 ABC transporter permease [Streptomyces clavuligerus]MBY6301583.1 ABC transporter permease [Streptomyces clavuligerus]QCS04525.1 ABC transporter permease [Streptomyces clavuligerus]QPJ96096.1 ABC transporter permease subunit [Streptomyces clavuligerus]